MTTLVIAGAYYKIEDKDVVVCPHYTGEFSIVKQLNAVPLQNLIMKVQVGIMFPRKSNTTLHLNASTN